MASVLPQDPPAQTVFLESNFGFTAPLIYCLKNCRFHLVTLCSSLEFPGQDCIHKKSSCLDGHSAAWPRAGDLGDFSYLSEKGTRNAKWAVGMGTAAAAVSQGSGHSRQSCQTGLGRKNTQSNN